MPAFGGAVIIGLILLAVYVLNLQRIQFDAQQTLPENLQTATATDFVQRLAEAISFAEGFGRPGVIPTIAHNPGDLVIPNWQGATLGSGISVFSSDAEGWSRLYHQLNLIANGNSLVYDLSDTISSMAQKWTTTDQEAWAANVANSLGVSTDTPLSSVLS